jgi:hypothetical protein
MDNFKKHVILYTDTGEFRVIWEDQISQLDTPPANVIADLTNMIQEGVALATMTDNSSGTGLFCYLVSLASLRWDHVPHSTAEMNRLSEQFEIARLADKKGKKQP